MVRALAEQIEGVIALVIYIIFLLFYLSSFKISVLNKVELESNDIKTSILMDNLIENMSETYHLITAEVIVPKATKEYFCSIKNVDIRRDFCERFPVYYPFNVSVFTKYTGIVNGTVDSFIGEDGLFFYANFSSFDCIDTNYVLIRIYNPNNKDLENYQIFITSPTIRDKLKEGHHIKINDTKIAFCYHHENFVCNSTPNNAYGIWIKVPELKAHSSIVLNVTFDVGISSQEKEGKDIFEFYDHFEYPNETELQKVWNTVDISCEKVSNTEWRCRGNNANSLFITKKSVLSAGNYTIYFKIHDNTDSEDDFFEDFIGYIIHYDCRLVFHEGFSFLSCNVNGNKKIMIYDEDYGSWLWNYLDLTIDYIIVKKQAQIEPFVEILEEPYCKRKYKIVVGPYIVYQYARDLDKEPIRNNYLKYIECLAPRGTTGCLSGSSENTNSLREISDNYIYWEKLEYVSRELEKYGESLYNNASIAIFNKYSGEFNDWSYTLRKILFSNSRWFIVNLEMLSNKDKNEFNHYLINSSSGYLIEPPYFITERIDTQTIRVGNPLKLSMYSISLVNHSMFTFNYPTELTYNLKIGYEKQNRRLILKKYNRLYSRYIGTFDRNEYKNFLIYAYAYPNSIDLREYQYYFRLPEVKIKSIKEINAIPVDSLNKIPKDVYIELEGMNKNFGDARVKEQYQHVYKIPVNIFSNNSIFKDMIYIYVK